MNYINIFTIKIKDDLHHLHGAISDDVRKIDSITVYIGNKVSLNGYISHR